MTQVFTSAEARAAAASGRAAAREHGHRLDAFRPEAGRPTAVCGCGLYVFVQRDGRDWAWGHGRLPGSYGSLAHHNLRAAV